MFLDVIDHKIRKAFSKSAIQYDVLTSLHKEIGRELTAKLALLGVPENVLDVGMGTGWFTNRLANAFSDAKVFGVDLADGMVQQAQAKWDTFTVVQGNAKQLPFKSDCFDLITSNLSFQWADPLAEAFQSCFHLMKNKGRLCMTVFAEETFKELFISLKETGQDRNFKRLPKGADFKKALEDVGFNDIEVKSEIIKVRYPDMYGLLKWIKDIGANQLSHDVIVGKDWLSRANQYYEKNFQDRLGIYATFEVVWIEGKK